MVEKVILPSRHVLVVMRGLPQRMHGLSVVEFKKDIIPYLWLDAKPPIGGFYEEFKFKLSATSLLIENTSVLFRLTKYLSLLL